MKTYPTSRKNEMSLTLPPAISTYFECSNGADTAALSNSFSKDAVVLDEGQTHRGIDAIRAWQHEARTKSEYTVTPVDISQTGERLTVTAEVVGSFPGSPARLAHAFVMAGQKIQSLEIH